MFAIYAARSDSTDPLSALEVGDIAAGDTPSDWVDVDLRACALNHHDVFSLRGSAFLPSGCR